MTSPAGVTARHSAAAARGLRCGLALIAAALLVALVAAPGFADPTSEYGEVTRFGGFDSSAFNSENYSGPITPGKFLDPTGFAVDPEDNTVYVVDRTSKYSHNPTSWRIQQFSPAGVVLGTTTFTLRNSNFGAYAIAGLAVDHRAGRLYAMVIGSPPAAAPIQSVPVAYEVLAWSTTANAAAELQGAAGLPADPLHTSGALVSSAAQLGSGPTWLYAPQGIAIDRLDSPGVDNPVVTEASDLVPGAGAGHPIQGDTIVQQVATGGANTGHLLGRWSAAELKQALGASWGPMGISSSPDGSLTVLLDASNLSSTDAYVVKLNADLSHPVALNPDSVEPPISAPDQEALWVDESPFYTFAGVGVSDLVGAGTEITRLSTAASSDVNGFFVADLWSSRRDDVQFSPSKPGSEYWLLEQTVGRLQSNIGIRMLRPGAGEAISDPVGATIANTLGNGTADGPCNIGAPEATLAAGANGTLWVLLRGPRADQPGGEGLGRQVIELAPGRGRLCPQPSGTFSMTPAGGTHHAGEGTLTIPTGTEVTFDASTIDRENGKPFAYEWDLDGNPANGPLHDGFETVRQMRAPEYYWPSSKLVHLYTQPGHYTIRARMRSDYGFYTTPPGTVIVTGSAHPKAEFTATVTPHTQEVTVNGSGSVAGVGSITNYHWNWGDGSSEDDPPAAAIVTHSFAQPGTYEVKLTVTNSSFQSATSTGQAVKVEAPAVPVRGPENVFAGPPSSNSPVSYPIPAPPSHGKPTRLAPRVRVGARALSVALSCPTSKARCSGVVLIETAKAFAAKAPGSRKRVSGRSLRRLLLGRAYFNLGGGQHRVVQVRLPGQVQALLRKLKRLSVLVTVSAYDPSGNPGVATLQLTLGASSARRARSASSHS